MATTTFTIPQTTLPAGPLVFGPVTVDNTVSQYVLTLNQIGWPFAGDLAFTYSCDVSLDGGVTWLNPPPSSGDVWDLPVPARHGQPANQFIIACSIPPGTGRRIRFSATLSKSLTVSGSLVAN